MAQRERPPDCSMHRDNNLERRENRMTQTKFARACTGLRASLGIIAAIVAAAAALSLSYAWMSADTSSRDGTAATTIDALSAGLDQIGCTASTEQRLAVPDVVGLPKAEALDRLSAVGLEGRTTHGIGMVASQNPSAGELIGTGACVELRLGSAAPTGR